MMSKASYLYRLKVLALLSLILSLGILFAGCKPASQDAVTPTEDIKAEAAPVTVTPVVIPEETAAEEATPAPAATTVPAESAQAAPAETPPAAPSGAETGPVVPATPAPDQSPVLPTGTDSSALKASDPKYAPPKPEAINVSGATDARPAKVEDAEDLIQLYEKVAELKKAGKLNSKTTAAAEKKHKELLEKAKVVQFADKVDLLAVSLRMVGPEKARLYFLFRPKEKLSADYKLGLTAFVDTTHTSALSDKANKESLSEPLTFWPKPATSDWAPDKEVLITTEVPLKPIPYRLSLGLYANDPPSRLGDPQDLGWYAGISKFATGGRGHNASVVSLVLLAL